MHRLLPAALACLLPTLAAAQDRLPTIPPDRYTDRQKQAAGFLGARKVPVFGPFEVNLVGINGTPLPRLPE